MNHFKLSILALLFSLLAFTQTVRSRPQSRSRLRYHRGYARGHSSTLSLRKLRHAACISWGWKSKLRNTSERPADIIQSI